ncbi:hypothetical protein IWW36_004656 [Coemansia brasiliensis]|uniref:Major facilitator superfamily (MFS) profile domain-containing protein n=1 Tax=Coemansia brasiliensis TaxID=2650707 RepID=A0A9W8I2X7_9FUNG|nr:hypothetical protein IWW36_004656 [Coemansia brasiliensis]
MKGNEYPSVGAKVSKVEYAEIDNIELVASEDVVSTEDQANLLASYCRKIDWHILLYVTVLCILNQSDRGSIGVAKVVGLENDLGMVKNDFNIASTLFTVGYLSLEFFSNFVLKWIGASRLLPTLGILWGLVCAMQGVITTKAQLYAMRVLLGMSECGFTAGSLLIMSFYYPKSKMTSRISLFYLSSPLANVLSGPLASALSQIHHPTIKRWQWVFLLEGIMTIVVSIVGYFVLQDHPEKCRFLKHEEREFIRKYKQKEGTLGGSQKLKFAHVVQVLKDWQLWIMMVGTFAACEACGSVTVFAPEVINELGFSAAQAQAMSALPSVCGVIAMLLVSRIVRLCGSHWLAGFISLGVALAGSVLMVVTLNVPARIVGLCMTGAGGFAGLGIFPGWNVTANSKSVAMSAAASGLTVFFGSSSSFVLSNVFLNSDAPRFVIGHTVNIGIFALGMASCAITRISMGQRNHKQHKNQFAEDAFLYEY